MLEGRGASKMIEGEMGEKKGHYTEERRKGEGDTRTQLSKVWWSTEPAGIGTPACVRVCGGGVYSFQIIWGSGRASPKHQVLPLELLWWCPWIHRSSVCPSQPCWDRGDSGRHVEGCRHKQVLVLRPCLRQAWDLEGLRSAPEAQGHDRPPPGTCKALRPVKEKGGGRGRSAAS